MKGAPAPLGRGVVVLGMHRSGTSAVTGVIDAMGLPACIPEDRMPVHEWNARGNYESRNISSFDERLLDHLGGKWFIPPKLHAGWEAQPGLREFHVEAARLFREAHPFASWVWKDPRACLLMPFWDLVLGAAMPRIIVLRNPLESASSLESRNRLPREVSLALAERYLRSAIRDSARRPVLLTAYDELFDDLDGWCSRAASFASLNGVRMPGPPDMDRARDFLAADLRHFREPDATPDLGGFAGLSALWSWARERIGTHSALSIEGLPSESPQTESLFRALRQGEQLSDP